MEPLDDESRGQNTKINELEKGGAEDKGTGTNDPFSEYHSRNREERNIVPRNNEVFRDDEIFADKRVRF